jgi:hypothetical protein
MLLVLLLLSITGEDVPAAAAAETAAQAAPTRCENARVHSVEAQDTVVLGTHALKQEPLANAYRPVVRHVGCDRPVIVATRVGDKQR